MISELPVLVDFSYWLRLILYLALSVKKVLEDVKKNKAMLTKASVTPFYSIEWFKATDNTNKLTGTHTGIGMSITFLLSHPKSCKENPFFVIFEIWKNSNK